ncbi:hypothetical protein B0F90DRAFT_1938144 [Multifurca ochricompacta]|uniref:BBC1/AIM3 cysteine proteinase-fold domain-containing protein n=1 Tax=Multifurca ochricompacta TaxID=376703 RepID=A0AAD4M3Q6_9AGAM|nr:hypothetical protein B0F90DRAFT_1938144 [Multifurca ochricompacta]
MAPFSASALKEKAAQVKSAGIKSYSSAREKLSSASGGPSTTKAAKSPPGPGPGPPPPPSRKISLTQKNSVNVGGHSRSEDNTTDDVDEIIDWANLSHEDKQVFFAWLDEFFARYLDLNPSSTLRVPVPATENLNNNTHSTPSPRTSPSLPSRRQDVSFSAGRRRQVSSSEPLSSDVESAATSTTTGRRTLPPVLSQRGPPKINFSTKPSVPTEVSEPPQFNASTKPAYHATVSPSPDLQMSFPPPAVNGSAAADLASYMHPSTIWDTDWYTSNSPIPPYLNGSPEIRFSGSLSYSGGGVQNKMTARGVILFSDLSICWYSVTYGGKGGSGSGSGSGHVPPPTRWARFRPRPEPILSGEILRRASEIYGTVVAAFAERAVASGRPVARGECWDIAHEALLHAASLWQDDAPILSTSRAHGHLIFCGKPGLGKWRGGDDRFRAGDIIEWRSVRIGLAQPQSQSYGGGGGGGAFALLGDPDHTSVLVEDIVVPPSRYGFTDGESVRLADIGLLTVVEQTAGRAPQRTSYDLARLQEGEIWVYRPLGMVEYLGSTLSVDIPPGLETYAI